MKLSNLVNVLLGRQWYRVGGRMQMNPTSDFLFAAPSFFEGAARAIDFGNTLDEYNTSFSPDEIALLMDWAVVGAAIHDAMATFAKSERLADVAA